MKNKSGIYTITSPSGKQYVGSAVDFDRRWRLHLRQLRNGIHHSHVLQMAFKKYGESGLRFSVLLICQKENLLMHEQLAIDTLDPAYNICRIAGSSLGVKRRAETRAKVSLANKGEKHRCWGKPHSEEMRAKLSASNTGVRRSKETCERVSASKRGVPLSQAHRAAISAGITGPGNPNWGKKLMQEQRDRISGKNHHMFGKKHTEEARKKMRGINNGPKHYRSRAVVGKHKILGDEIRFETITDAVKWLQGNGFQKAGQSAISLCCIGDRKVAYGYGWSYSVNPRPS